MRNLKKEEYDLIIFLLKDKPDTKHILDKLPLSLVEEMDDGRMGSLKFLAGNKIKKSFCKQVAEISLLDTDNVPVSFTVNLDNDGQLFELDVFKADFSPLKQFPLYPYVRI